MFDSFLLLQNHFLPLAFLHTLFPQASLLSSLKIHNALFNLRASVLAILSGILCPQLLIRLTPFYPSVFSFRYPSGEHSVGMILVPTGSTLNEASQRHFLDHLTKLMLPVILDHSTLFISFIAFHSTCSYLTNYYFIYLFMSCHSHLG